VRLVCLRRGVVQEHELLNRYVGAAGFSGCRICAPRAFMIVAPEGGKRAVEDLELFIPLDEERTAGSLHFAAVRDVHVAQRFNHIDEAPGLNSDAHSPQHATKDHEVLEKKSH
jgi:hypothetical protein